MSGGSTVQHEQHLQLLRCQSMVCQLPEFTSSLLGTAIYRVASAVLVAHWHLWFAEGKISQEVLVRELSGTLPCVVFGQNLGSSPMTTTWLISAMLE